MSQTKKDNRTKASLLEELAELRARLDEAEQTLDAIRTGAVDALVIAGPQGEQIYSLSGAERVYRVLIEAMNEGALTIDLSGYILFCNPRFCEIVKRPMEEVLGKRLTTFAAAGQQTAVSALVSDAAQDGPVRGHLMLMAGGTSVPVQLSASLLGAADPPCICMVVSDLTEIEASARSLSVLKEQEQALKAANKELESFAYSVSHDLRAPLRAIEGYSRMILKRQGDHFDEETRRQFGMIRTNTEMMGRLIDDLLEFSRLGRQQITRTKLDMEGMIQEVWENLHTANPDRNMTLHSEGMLPGMGDPSLIREVFSNLLGNAVKFSRTRDAVLIDAGSMVEDNETVYYIRDNGIGFDMKFHDKLFGVFQRLHGPGEFEGTGIGLALVFRIIHRHGGRVWADSEPDRGATFYFSLPASVGHIF